MAWVTGDLAGFARITRGVADISGSSHDSSFCHLKKVYMICSAKRFVMMLWAKLYEETRSTRSVQALSERGPLALWTKSLIEHESKTSMLSSCIAKSSDSDVCMVWIPPPGSVTSNSFWNNFANPRVNNRWMLASLVRSRCAQHSSQSRSTFTAVRNAIALNNNWKIKLTAWSTYIKWQVKSARYPTACPLSKIRCDWSFAKHNSLKLVGSWTNCIR